ncbi:MAG: ABC transporter ATP-binding protein/permease [Bacteroides sp.]|nr:ABC transporter ATP-binding protein/permease [Bacteroides sp.]
MENTKVLSLKEKYSLLKRALKDVHRISPGYLGARLAVQFFNAMEQFIPIYLSGLIIDGISGGRPFKEIITITVVSLIVGFALQSSGQCFHKLLQEKFHRLGFYSDIALNEKVLKMDYTKIEDPEVQTKNDRINNLSNMYNYGLLYNISEDVSIVFYGICTVILSFITAADLFSGSLSFSDPFSLLINLSFTAVIIFIIIFTNIMTGKCTKKEQDMFDSDEFTSPLRILNYLMFSYSGPYRAGKEIRIYGQKNFLLKRYKELFDQYNCHWLKTDRLWIKNDILTETLGILRNIVIYAFVGYKAILGSISAGAVIKDVQSFFKLKWGLNRIIMSVTFINVILPNLKKIYDYLDMPDEKYMGSIPTEKRDDNEYEFEFKHVWFKYPGSEQYVLRDINLKWRIGEKMALVGKNGCGKSTLVKLLCRLYDPTEGEITLNGIDIKKYKYKDYIDLFSVVFQDSGMFSFTIAENVAAGGDYDRERVKDCVIRAGMGDRLREMEKGIDTFIYKDYDDSGIEISGGENQKLCLARAIYKGAPFIVLDEPTAALDPVSEHDIYTKFNSIADSRTAVYISHRLSSCRFCDDITVMDNGSIVERGSHSELLEKNGLYKELWSAQAEYYKDTAGELFS